MTKDHWKTKASKRGPLGAVALLLASVCHAQDIEPSQSDIDNAYRAYRTEICSAVAPPPTAACVKGGATDTGAQRIMLEEYCANRSAAAAVCGPVNTWRKALRLTYDHAGTVWMKPAGNLGERTEFDVNRIPMVALTRGEKLFAVVQSTNPLLYAVTEGEIKQDNIEQLADLQKLAGLLGGNIAAVFSARSAAGGAAVFDADVIKLNAISKDVEHAQCLASATALYSFNAVAFIDAVESGGTGEYDLSSVQCDSGVAGAPAVPADLQAVTPAWSKLLAHKEVVERYCSDVFDALVSLIDADSSKPADVRSALIAFERAVLNPSCAFLKQGGPPTIEDTLRRQHVTAITNALQNGAADELKRQLDIARSQIGTNIRVMQLLVKTGGEALQQLIAGGPAVRKAMANREEFRNRVLGALTTAPSACSTAAANRCASAAAVTRLLVVRGGPTKVKWDKVDSHPFKIAVSSPFAAEVVPVRPTAVDASYKAKSVATSVWDIGVAAIDTDLISPVFGVEKNPANQTVIAVTDEEARSGKFAMMFNYLPLRHFFPTWSKYLTALGVQVGAGLDSDSPAFFWGLSYGFGKYVRVGWGRTSQRVNDLRGQEVGDPVPDKEAIRTQDRFERDHYLSLTISIGSLKLFNPS